MKMLENARKGSKLPPGNKKIETFGGRCYGPAAGLDFSPLPIASAAVVADQARGREPLQLRQETVPRPGTIRWGRA